jgi:L-rhamnonate dehydratase
MEHGKGEEMTDARIVRIEGGILTGERPRKAGSNARLGEHGTTIRLPIVRITTADGARGFGRCRALPTELRGLLGRSLDELLTPQGIAAPWLACEYPLWDLAGQRSGQPVYALAARINERPVPTVLTVPTYDTSLYFDDLHLTDDDEAATLLAAEAREGEARGHRAFKVKVGRGARHMPTEAGLRRDIAIIRAIRAAIGPTAPLLLDANNGYTLNIAKELLRATADCTPYWLEEAFHEDGVLYADLRAWLLAEGLTVLIADGEGDASPQLLNWASEGLIDVVQYDIFARGFTPWLALGRDLDTWGQRSAPHHYGAHYGNYVAGHLAAAIEGFTFVEWDEATTPGLDTSAYTLAAGRVAIPNRPGFGLTLDEATFRAAVATGGFEFTD